MPSLMPEFFMLLGIDFFLAISLLTCIFDKHFPDKLDYLYQLVALAGFGQLLVTHEFMPSFPNYMRFWYSTIYLIIALANILALNAYLLIFKKKRNFAKLFAVVATAPTVIISTLFLYNYASEAAYPLIPLPQISLDIMFISVFTFDVMVVSASVYALVKPKWWQITIPSIALVAAASVFIFLKPMFGERVFIAGAMYIYTALGIACFGVLGAGLYVLLRFWRETHKLKEVK